MAFHVSKLGLMATFALLIQAGVQAAPVTMSNAAYAGSFVRDCRSQAARDAASTVPDRCEVTGIFPRLAEFQDRHTLGGFTASSFATNPLGQAMGKATGSEVDASGDLGVLRLRQGAFSGTSYARSSGHSLALQSFTYSGLGSSARRIENIFDFTANVTPNADLNTGGGSGSLLDPVVYAKTRVVVFSLATSSLEFDLDLGFDTQGAGYYGQSSARADFVLEGEVDNLGITTTGARSYLDFTMVAGRTYYVQSYLGLWARFGGWIDGMHTFTTQMGVQDGPNGFRPSIEGLVIAPQSSTPVIIDTSGGRVVPEPASLALVLAGLALAQGLRRRT